MDEELLSKFKKVTFYCHNGYYQEYNRTKDLIDFGNPINMVSSGHYHFICKIDFLEAENIVGKYVSLIYDGIYLENKIRRQYISHQSKNLNPMQKSLYQLVKMDNKFILRNNDEEYRLDLLNIKLENEYYLDKLGGILELIYHHIPEAQ